MRNTQIILGPPGTGKTTTLLNIVEKALADGVKPDRIGYVSFTKKAALEAKQRAQAKFKLPGFKYFRTLHSLAYEQLGLNRGQVMTKKHVKAFAEIMNLELSGTYEYGEMVNLGTTNDDKVMAMENLARITLREMEEIVHESDEDISYQEVLRVRIGLAAYKSSWGVLDFTDFLVKAIEQETILEFDLLVVDEAQDLSALQWKYVDKLAKDSKQIYIAGDDDQAIFKWNGADVDHLQNIDAPRKVLHQSWRVPHRIHHLASRAITDVKDRIPKFWKPRQGAEGDIVDYGSVDQLDLNVGSWYILARNDYLLAEAKAYCQTMSHYYMYKGQPSVDPEILNGILEWEEFRKPDTPNLPENTEAFVRLIKKNPVRFEDLDMSAPWYTVLDNIPPFTVEYIRGMLSNGEVLSELPRITISTIHGVKGGEADNVALIQDMAPKTFDHYVNDPDDENRVLYVALTRTRETLHLIDPQTDMHYEF